MCPSAISIRCLGGIGAAALFAHEVAGERSGKGHPDARLPRALMRCPPAIPVKLPRGGKRITFRVPAALGQSGRSTADSLGTTWSTAALTLIAGAWRERQRTVRMTGKPWTYTPVSGWCPCHQGQTCPGDVLPYHGDECDWDCVVHTGQSGDCGCRNCNLVLREWEGADGARWDLVKVPDLEDAIEDGYLSVCLLCGWWYEDGIPPDAGGLIRCSHCPRPGSDRCADGSGSSSRAGEHTAPGMTGAGQGGADKRHRTTAPLTPDPLRTQKSAETPPWTLLGATLVGALRKITRGGARMSPPRPSPSNPNPKPSHETRVNIDTA